MSELEAIVSQQKAPGGMSKDDEAPQKNPFLEFQVIVLAGGSGSRLSGLLDVVEGAEGVSSKAVLPVANRPMIWYCLRNLQEATFGDVIVVSQTQQQAELSAYLQQEFRESFRRLEVVGLNVSSRNEADDGGDDQSCGYRRRSLDGTYDPEQRVCGTAEALQQIRHLITTDFIVLSCDIIGHIDFFALANRHRTEGAACTLYLLPSDPLDEAAGKGKFAANKAGKRKNNTSRGNPVTVVLDDTRVQLLALQDRHSMSHGSSLLISKLHLFIFPSQHLLSNYYDPHVYVFAFSTLKIFDDPTLRNSLYSIRFDLVPYLICMQMTQAAQVWAESRLDCDIFKSQLVEVQRRGEIEEEMPKRISAFTTVATEVPCTSPFFSPQYTAATPPPRPAKGNRVVCCMHPDAAGICCRVNNIEDYHEMNNRFCCGRLDELRAVLPDWALPEHNPKKPGNMRDSIVADGVTVEGNIVLKRSIVGKNVFLRDGCKVAQSVLMTGSEIGENAVLQRVILCSGVKVGKNCKLVNCQVRAGFHVPDETHAEDTTLPTFIDSVDFVED